MLGRCERGERGCLKALLERSEVIHLERQRLLAGHCINVGGLNDIYFFFFLVLFLLLFAEEERRQ